MRNNAFPFLPKDFIQTKEGLIFAVVCYQPQATKVGCFLRYVADGQGWKKVDTEQANSLLQTQYPQYLYTSSQFDTRFHAVAPRDIVQHFQPENKLKQLIQQQPLDDVAQKLHTLIAVLLQYGANSDSLGLTGSMLIDQHRSSSDIDLVVYGRDNFHHMRQAIQQAIADEALSHLDSALMQDNFERRAAQLSYSEFAWHEYRKCNKAAIEGTKFDIGMVCLWHELEIDTNHYQKQGMRTFKTKVIDDHRAFDFPAYYRVDDDMTPEVLSFTHTYVGQAKNNELIEVSGTVEYNIATGQRRLIVGSTREAEGEYIKVCR
ncbi:MAG: hypothetical protein P1P93_07680 [Gammaproteobacteria bacterium]|nr:hypothetical protein [Gammaproteobacteria bacterium]